MNKPKNQIRILKHILFDILRKKVWYWNLDNRNSWQGTIDDKEHLVEAQFRGKQFRNVTLKIVPDPFLILVNSSK